MFGVSPVSLKLVVADAPTFTPIAITGLSGSVLGFHVNSTAAANADPIENSSSSNPMNSFLMV